MKSYYDILGVSKRASNEEIKQKYKELVLMYHPDKNPSAPLNTIKLLNEAYSIIGDPYKRGRYDEQLRYSRKNKQDNLFNTDVFGINDIINNNLNDMLDNKFLDMKNIFFDKNELTNRNNMHSNVKSFSFSSQNIFDNGKIKTKQYIGINDNGEKDEYFREIKNNKIVRESGNRNLMRNNNVKMITI